MCYLQKVIDKMDDTLSVEKGEHKRVVAQTRVNHILFGRCNQNKLDLSL